MKDVKQPAEETDHGVEHLLQTEENEVQYNYNRQWRKVPESQGVHPAVDNTIGFFTMKDKKEKKDMEVDLHWKCLCGVQWSSLFAEGPSYMRKLIPRLSTRHAKTPSRQNLIRWPRVDQTARSKSAWSRFPFRRVHRKQAWWKNTVGHVWARIIRFVRHASVDSALWPTRRSGPMRPTIYIEVDQIKNSSSKKWADPGPRAITIVGFAKEYGGSCCKSSFS